MSYTRTITVTVEEKAVVDGEEVYSTHTKSQKEFLADEDRGFPVGAEELQRLLMRIGRDKSSRRHAQASQARRRFPTGDEVNTTIRTEG